MSWVAIGLGIVSVVVLVDQLGLWAERRGWVYWRQGKGGGGGAGNALGELNAFFTPEARHVQQAEARAEQQDDDDEGDDPRPFAG